MPTTDRERSGSVVECLTPDRGAAGPEPHQRYCVVVFEQYTFILMLTRDRGAAGSSLTGVTALWSLSKALLS